MTNHDISWHFAVKKLKTSLLSRKRSVTAFLSQKFTITRSSIAFEDLLASSIAPQVMPHCSEVCTSIWPACNPGKAQGSLIFDCWEYQNMRNMRTNLKKEFRINLHRNCVWMVSTSSSQWPRRRLVWVLIRWTWLKLMVAVTEAQDCINNQPFDSTLSMHVTCDQV